MKPILTKVEAAWTLEYHGNNISGPVCVAMDVSAHHTNCRSFVSLISTKHNRLEVLKAFLEQIPFKMSPLSTINAVDVESFGCSCLGYDQILLIKPLRIRRIVLTIKAPVNLWIKPIDLNEAVKVSHRQYKNSLKNMYVVYQEQPELVARWWGEKLRFFTVTLDSRLILPV